MNDIQINLEGIRPTAEKLKHDFMYQNQKYILNGDYSAKDIERLKLSNKWVKAFYDEHQNYEKTLLKMDKALRWREVHDANEILSASKYQFSEELFENGFLFIKNVDNKNRRILHFVARNYNKGDYDHQQLEKFFMFFFEKLYSFNADEQIVFLIDMYDVNHRNLDPALIKLVMQMLSDYYPGLVAEILVYQSPFYLNAFWKILAKIVRPANINLIRFVDKKTIKQYINNDELLAHMGGSNNYQYVYVPGMFKRKLPSAPVRNHHRHGSSTDSI